MNIKWITFYTKGFTDEEGKQIGYFGNYIENLMLRFINNGFNIKGLGKVSIKLRKEPGNPMIEGVLPGSAVCIIEKTFDMRKFIDSEPHERRLILLEEIKDSFLILSDKYGWDISSVLYAYRNAIKYNAEYKFVFSPVKMSRNRKLKAGIEVELSQEQAIVSVLIFDAKSDEIMKKVLLETYKSPDIMAYEQLLDKRKWLNNDEYEIITRPSDFRYVVSFSDGSFIKERMESSYRDDLKALYHFKKLEAINLPNE